jgi:hypothetical protein
MPPGVETGASGKHSNKEGNCNTGGRFVPARNPALRIGGLVSGAQGGQRIDFNGRSRGGQNLVRGGFVESKSLRVLPDKTAVKEVAWQGTQIV